MNQYNLPRSPSARAARRNADLQDQHRRRHKQRLRRDRRRWAFATMKKRRTIVRDYQGRRGTDIAEAEAAAQTAARFGLSASSVRRFYRCWREGGKRALLPCYRRPSRRGSPLPFAVIEVILALRARLGWCGQRIAHELETRGIARVSHQTVYRVFRRYHVAVRCYHPVGKRDGIRYRRQRTRAPNWTWHIDFAGPWTDQDGRKQSLVVVIDSYSRMLLALEVVEGQRAESVEAVLEALFARYGTPQVLITDNGRAFAPSLPNQGHRLWRFLAQHGVEHRRARPYYPQTNGKAEAVIKTIEREFLRLLGWRKGTAEGWRWSEIAAERAAFQGWYNFYRAHSALGYQVPAARYAGIALDKQGLANIFGLLAESAVAVEALPMITQNNRLDRLSLALAA